MDRSTLASEIDSVLSVSHETFKQAVTADAERLLEYVKDGVFDNPQAITGLEYELYAVDSESGALERVPRRLLEYIGFEKELGLHNAELSTQPLPLNTDGIAAQEAAVRAQLRTATACVEGESMQLVSDGLWTIPPTDETAETYLTETVDVSGYTVATNMSAAPRYHAMANADSPTQPAMKLDREYCTLEATTVMPESLITSIQPHYQVPDADSLPERFRYALRIAGPLVALGANAPFLPPDLYDSVDPAAICAESWVEERIPIFETVLNAPDGSRDLVAFPRDIDSVEEAIDRIATDPVLVPLETNDTGRFDDTFAAFRMKHGTYWRWVRPVFDGPTRSAANARLEFRPLSAQPTIRDSIAFLACFAGLMEALPATDHPVRSQSWDQAESNFYAAAADGLGSDLTWITGSGEETVETIRLYEDLFAHAGEGLRMAGLDAESVARYLGPLERRVRYGLTPAEWKQDRVETRLREGDSLTEAITTMQREYLERQHRTLFTGDFSEWLEDDRYRTDNVSRR